MTKPAPHYIAADLGGTKIRAAVFNAVLQPLYKTELASEAYGGRERVLSALAEAIDRTSGWLAQHAPGAPVSGIGISTAGVVDARRGVILDATDAIPGWRGTELAAWLEARFRLPVAVENDVKCALLGELNASPALATSRVVMLTLGTGLGGAIAEAGEIVGGAHSVAGHFGRMPVPSPWEQGAMLPLEVLVSGTGLANVANSIGGAREYSNGRAVLEQATSGDAQALLGLDRFCGYLTMSLEQLYWALDPDAILIGGGLVEAREQWWQRLQDKCKHAGLPTEIRPAQLNNDAGLYGAGALIKSMMNAGVGADAGK